MLQFNKKHESFEQANPNSLKAIEEMVEEAKRCEYLGQIHYLPVWPSTMRAMSNEVQRSSLFTVRDKRKPRAGYTERILCVVGQHQATYTGVELRAQDDELVLLQVIQYGRTRPLGSWVEFTARQACLNLGWKVCGYSYKRLRECLIRLRAGVLAIESPRLGEWSGRTINLLEEFEWQNPATKESLPRYRVKLSAVLRRWFGEHHYAQLDWDKYKALDPIARRLYDYAASHREPHPLKLETLLELCGSDSRNPKNWRELVAEALRQLKAQGLLIEGYIQEGLVHLRRA